MSCMIKVNIKEIGQLLEHNVLEDINEFGKPALIYNYHHKLNQLNAIDTHEMWNKEQTSMKSQGWASKCIKKEVKIKTDIWECILWIFQPKTGNIIDEEKYLKMTKYDHDPLAMSIGYMVSGFCYLQFVIKK